MEKVYLSLGHDRLILCLTDAESQCFGKPKNNRKSCDLFKRLPIMAVDSF